MASALTYIFLLASVQGFLLTILLFTRKQNHVANIILGILVGALSLDLLQKVYYVNSLYEIYPHLMGITNVFPFLYGPIFYLYAVLLTGERRRLAWRDLLHFVPAAVILTSTSWVYFLTGQEKIEFIHTLDLDRPAFFRVVDYLLPIQGLTYTVLTILVLARHTKRIRDAFSNIDRINLIWLRTLTIGVGIIWSVVAAGVVVPALLNDFNSHGFDVAIYFCISLLVYTIGYMGLDQPEVFRQSTGDVVPDSSTDEPVGRYTKSGLSDSTAGEILKKLQELMETSKPYLDGELTLTKLAQMIAVTPHNLSEAMNTRLQQSFYELVNIYRVDEVKRRLQAGDAQRFSLLSIAYDSGFTSKTSFNTIFKKQTGMTPSQFLTSLPTADAARQEETE
jgi:AraC-like DNA-binding protein